MLIAIQEVTSLVHPREVFRLAIAYGTAGIIVAHNHPSATPRRAQTTAPSPASSSTPGASSTFRGTTT